MSRRCCVPDCNKTRADNTILHTFPNPDKDVNRFNTWRNAIGGPIMSLEPHTVFDLRRVCHLHFEQQYHTWSNRLSHNAVPTLHLSVKTNDISIADQTPRSVIHLNPTTRTETRETMQVDAVPCTSKGPDRKRRQLKCFDPAINALGKKIKMLQKAKASATLKLKKALKLSENITFQKTLQKFTTAATIFTIMQFREAGKSKTGRRFEKDEKIMALALYKQGPRAYRWLRNFFTLPSPLTLSRMIRCAGLKQGINEKLFDNLQKRANKMKTNEKLCVLMFDEVSLSPHFDYNRRTDCISGFSKSKNIADHALVFMVRGIHKNYKQPVAYSFCSKTTPKMELVTQIKEIVRKLITAGFVVVTTVCDQGATNVSAINYLINETREKYLKANKEFKHSIFEIEGHEIIPLYDPPHLIKGIRNNLLTKDLKCVINGKEKTAKWDHILKMFNEDPAYKGLRLLPKLTERHVVPAKISKMKVKCATQVFSQTVAANMGYLANHGILPKECEETADILLFFDQLFDSVNGSFNKYQKKGAKLLLGPVTPRSPHHKVWNEGKKILKSMKYVKSNSLGVVPSLTHWLETIENIQYMIESLSKKYGLTSIWMRHFNQDPLENFFGCIRSHGYRNISPSCAGFEAAFASLLVNNLSNVHSKGSNCEEDTCKVFKSLRIMFFTKSETSNPDIEIDFEDIVDFEFENFEQQMNNSKIKAQLEYVSGYVLRKVKNKVFKNCQTCTSSLCNKNNEGSSLVAREYFQVKKCLTYPSLDFIKCFSHIQDVVTNVVRKDCARSNIKSYIRTVLSVIMDYKFINCKTHKSQIINICEDISINLFLYSYCKDCNKLLKGIRSDDNDNVQKMCVNYFKKNFKRK